MMEQFCADDRSKDIFHTSPVMHTFTYAEQQFLMWVVMFWYKLATPLEQYLILFFFLSIFWYYRAIFHMERVEVIFLKGVYIFFNEMWPKCHAKCELKFYCQISNNIKYM